MYLASQVSCVSLSFFHCFILFCLVPATVKSTLLIGYYYSQSRSVINMMLSICKTAIPEGQDCCSSYNKYGIVNMEY